MNAIGTEFVAWYPVVVSTSSQRHHSILSAFHHPLYHIASHTIIQLHSCLYLFSYLSILFSFFRSLTLSLAQIP